MIKIINIPASKERRPYDETKKLLWFLIRQYLKERGICAEEVGQSDRSILSLCSQINSTKKIYIRREINKEKILILNFFERFKVWWYTTTKDLVMCAKMSEVNAIFNVILMFQVSRRPATC